MFTELNGCANCKRQNPKKRCAKRHTKCMNKLFCDGVCEKAAHTKSSAAPPENNENSDQALNVVANAKLEKAKAAEKKKKADKKAKKKPNQGTTRCSGEFWWA